MKCRRRAICNLHGSSGDFFWSWVLTGVKYHSILNACQEIFALLDAGRREGQVPSIKCAACNPPRLPKQSASLSGGTHEAAVPHHWLGFFAVGRYGSCGKRAHTRIRAGERDHHIRCRYFQRGRPRRSPEGVGRQVQQEPERDRGPASRAAIRIVRQNDLHPNGRWRRT